MKTKSFIGVCLTLCMIFTILSVGTLTAFAADDLTVSIDTGATVTLEDTDGDGYYDIGTADELYAFAAAVNDGNTAVNGELTADIVINKNVLDENKNLNGDGSNFRVWTPIGDGYIGYEYVGTFDGAEHTISGLFFNDTERSYVGLFGCINGTTVKNVGVIDSYFIAQNDVGGIIGSNYHGGITNCYYTGAVVGTEWDVGGVAGTNDGTITDCYNTGTVTGTGRRVGGVAGMNDGAITDCYNTGAVNGTDEYVGGVAGTNDGTITDCYNTGAVDGTMNVGGLVGENNKGEITNCYNIGTVTGTSDYIANEVGGIAGYNYYGTISNCFNIGDVNGTGDDVGGIAGCNYYGTITICYNTGTVTVTNPFDYGGVVGENSQGTITNCYYLAGCSQVGVGSDNESNATVISEVTEAQVEAAPGEDGALIDMLNEWVAQQTDEKYKGWHHSSDYPCLNLEYTYFYTAANGAISEKCEVCEYSASINLVLPEESVYNGNGHEVSCAGDYTNPNVNILIQYMRYNEDSETGYEILDSAPVDVGNYFVRFSVGDVYADCDMKIEPKPITLIGVEVNYKDYDGTPYVEIDTTNGYDGFKTDSIFGYDSINIHCTAAELESANAGTYEQVTVKGLTISGEDAHNYTIVSEATLPVYNIWNNYKSSVTVYKKYLTIDLFDQEAGSLDAIKQDKWEINEYYGILEGHRIESLKLVAETNEGSTKYGSISLDDGSVKIVDADGNDMTENYSVSAYAAKLTLTCPDHDEFEKGFCKNCGGYEKANYNENGNYYEIANAGQLFWFAEYIANVSNEANAKLMDNITIPNGKEWTPIDNLYGIFDGNNKTISGLQVNETASQYVGFLGYVGYWGDVRNLHITDSNFNGGDATYVGAIVGYHGGGEIINCYTDETVEVTGNNKPGSLVGFLYGTMKNCYAQDVLVGNGYYGTFENCYYIGEDDELDGTTAVAAEQFASGEVAYLLQSGIVGEPIYDDEGYEIGTAEPELIWGQQIGEEKYPKLLGSRVYKDEHNGTYAYRNEIDGFDIIYLDKSKKVATVVFDKAGTYTLIFADYGENNALSDLEIIDVSVTEPKAVLITSTKTFTLGTGDKVMLWQDMINLVPMCEAYIVK